MRLNYKRFAGLEVKIKTSEGKYVLYRGKNLRANWIFIFKPCVAALIHVLFDTEAL